MVSQQIILDTLAATVLSQGAEMGHGGHECVREKDRERTWKIIQTRWSQKCSQKSIFFNNFNFILQAR